MYLRRFFIVALVTIFAGCATYAGLNYDQLFGEQHVRDRRAALESTDSVHFLEDVKPIIDNRAWFVTPAMTPLAN